MGTVNTALALATEAASAYWQIFYSISAKAALAGDYAQVPGYNGPWRPPQWSPNAQAAFTIMPVASSGAVGPRQIFVFDGTIRAEHEQQSIVTLIPVQTGAAITDHVYAMPARLTVEIAMSDAMQSYTIGQWTTGPSRSISAYQQLKALQLAGTPLTIATKLETYPLMVITDCRAEETKDTKYALKATATFTQILTSLIEANQSNLNFDMTGVDTSGIPQTVPSTADGGQAQGQPTTPTTQSIYGVTPVGPGETQLTTVGGAGNFSSTPTPLTTGATPVKPGETPLTTSYIVPLNSTPNQLVSVNLPGI